MKFYKSNLIPFFIACLCSCAAISHIEIVNDLKEGQCYELVASNGSPLFCISRHGERVTIKNSDGKYVSANQDLTLSSTQNIAAWELFIPYFKENGSIVLKSYHNTYLAADEKKRLSLSRNLPPVEQEIFFASESEPISKFEKENCRQRRPSGVRVVAIGDVHGNLEFLWDALKLAGLVDGKFKWTTRVLTPNGRSTPKDTPWLGGCQERCRIRIQAV